jgi:hypothetical protein
MNYSFVDEVLNVVKENTNNSKVIIFMHPMDSRDAYHNQDYDEDVIIEKNLHYKNTDLLIMEPSTVFYDYLSINYEGQIILITKNDNIYDTTDNIKLIKLTSLGELRIFMYNYDK